MYIKEREMVPMMRIERTTSPLPRECSTTELHGRMFGLSRCWAKSQTSNHYLGPTMYGAGEGNRTLVISLEGFSSTIELHPQ